MQKKQTSTRMSVFCFFLHFFVFAGSGIVVLLQATHNTLPARSTALHIDRRQPKALYACRFPPALRDQTRRWYRKSRRFSLKNHLFFIHFFHSGLLYCLCIKNAKVVISKILFSYLNLFNTIYLPNLYHR